MKKTTFLKTLMMAIILLVANGMAWGQTVTYTISALSTLTTTGTAPSGSTATMVETYTTSMQMYKNNSQTLTLTGYSGYKITSITLSMRSSNASTGAGNLSYSIDGGSGIDIIPTANFNDPSWYGAYSTSFVDVIKAVDISCGTSSTVLKIAATVNWLGCSSYKLTYEPTGTSSYTINPSSNNESYGTVTLAGKIITATPVEGYTYADPAYTVSTGTATVAQSGNLFTVTPSTDCDVQINFEPCSITPSSNNTSYGTVSLSDKVITATPLTGYTYADPAYTVSTGTATVLQSGDLFTVTPTSNCSVQINFALPAPVATAATDVTGTSFTAHWGAVSNATGYKLDVYTGDNSEILNTSFEDKSSFPAGWKASPLGSAIQIALPQVHSGVQYAALTATDGNVYTPLLSSPKTITFWTKGNSATATFTVDVEYSSDASTWTNLATYSADGLNTGSITNVYSQKTIITNLAGNYYIRWNLSAWTKNTFCLDDVVITNGIFLNTYEIESVSGTSQLISGLSPFSSYSYVVRASDAVSSSANSNKISVGTSAYTILPSSNNTSYGTVSLSDNVITAAPVAGYTYADPAYTVTSGTATVAQSGNLFTVTASSDCAVQINFAADESTLNNNPCMIDIKLYPSKGKLNFQTEKTVKYSLKTSTGATLRSGSGSNVTMDLPQGLYLLDTNGAINKVLIP